MERQIITVDIAPGNNQIQRLKSSQGDIGRPLGVYIIQNGVALDCSSYTADLYILKPDGNFFTGTATVDATEHNLITWETAEQETPVAGDCAAQIRILSNGDDIGTARFVEYVEASPGFCGESSESVIDSLKEYVRQAAASAETASGAASSATGSASAASGSASAAASSASAAAGSASTAHTDAETASQAAQTAQDVADSIPEDYSTLSDDVTGLKSAIVTKAEIDGYYDGMAVGTAEQLLSKQSVEDQVPYGFRQSGGGLAIGDREEDMIIGGTVGWNQLIENWSDFIAQGGASFTYADGIGTAELPDNNAQIAKGIISGGTPSEYLNATHKYLTVCDLKLHDAAQRVLLFGGSQNVVRDITGTTNWVHVEGLLTNPYGFWLLRGTSTGAATVDVKNVMLINLTMLFGSTIADYIYNLEQTTSGAGIAWFRKYFPNDYYEYNPGELISVSGLQSHDMVGFNAWDEEWEVGDYDGNGEKRNNPSRIRNKNLIPVLPDSTYWFLMNTTSGIAWYFYDFNGNFISALSRAAGQGGFVIATPVNCRYLSFGTWDAYGNVYKNDICINISGSRNGEYEPYKKYSYPLDSSLILRGISQLDSNNKLYYDGDEYLPDGTVTRKYGIVDLGTLTWAYISAGTATARFQATGLRNIAKGAPNNNTAAKIICPKYETKAITLVANNADTDKAIGMYATSANATIEVRDSAYTISAAFKAAMSGVMLVYELETPETETAEPYQKIQICSRWGTEEFVTDSIVPVGHETRYPANLVEKLDGLPWNFSTLIAPTEETTTASRAYTVGSYLIYNNTLYKVVSAISSGGTITPGTNVTATTIMAELTALA